MKNSADQGDCYPPKPNLLYNELHLFSDWLKAYDEFSKSAPVMSFGCRLYNSHVKNTQGHGSRMTAMRDF